MNTKQLSPTLDRMEALKRISQLPKEGLYGEVIAAWFDFRLYDVLEMIQDQTQSCPREMKRFLGDEFEYFAKLNFKQ
ncbi:hypothetical protein UFOVP579_43 [uncultured Caudovirales phage]|uniref:Uncharacterized protein n=1 Tax=uncultured Caudovirales phage TaxID=2100421 RepID=A0A6J5PA15_9CAUD|nr:hypothetical protein UFOVP302_43 [uncultured Caudovirales phage]CAB4168739.1 hypothetical protein UFOVP579_43 [uncultured Caudovirales phage]